jgi:hypothetical protein
MTEETLDELKEDIEYFLKDERDEDGKEGENVNPFMALLGLYNKKPKKDSDKKSKEKNKKDEKIEIKSDNFYEKVLRKMAEKGAAEGGWNFFDKFKKSRGWAAHPGYGEAV